MGPLAVSDGHDAPGLAGQLVPGIFESYNEIVDHCCDAWNKLIGQPGRIMSIGHRQWANEF